MSKLKKFIEIDKSAKIFYDNLWLDDFKIAIKIPLLEKYDLNNRIKFEKFNLVNKIFLFAYD